MDLREILCEDVEWVQLTQYRLKWPALLNIIMNLRSHRSGKYLDQLSKHELFQKKILHHKVSWSTSLQFNNSVTFSTLNRE
jgi:hypothetical protein